MSPASSSAVGCSGRILARALRSKLPSPTRSRLANTQSGLASSSTSRPFSISALTLQQQERGRQERGKAPELLKPEPTSHASKSRTTPETPREAWDRHRAQYNYDPFTLHPEEKHFSYPLVTAKDLADRSMHASKMNSSHGIRPREVRMLARDFIHDSLYNPTYGYFSKQAVLLPDPTSQGSSRVGKYLNTSEDKGSAQSDMPEDFVEEMGLLRQETGFDFNDIKSESEFMRLVEERYELFEEQISLLVQHKDDAVEEVNKAKRCEQDLQAERAERRLLREQERQEQDDVADKATLAKSPTRSARVAAHSAEGLELAQRRGRALAQAAKEGVQEREVQSMAAKQVWHTPTQIFRPWYGRAIARYLVAEYKLHNYPYDDLIVYEMGAGSGALAHDVLEYLEQHQPEIYTRTRYRIVEISSRLAEEQSRRLEKHLHRGRVEVINQSILDWTETVPQPCFVIALEVFDNLAHDVVRYSTQDLTPYQAVVSIDDTGDMHELFEPVNDPLIRKYLDLDRHHLSQNTSGSSSYIPAPLRNSFLHRLLPDRIRNYLAKSLPLYPNMTQRHFLPTSSLVLLENLHTFFPQHRLIMSDFDSLPDTVKGVNAPVVQTRHERAMVPVTTYMVLQGHFDIFFPTNFEDLRATYTKITSQSQSHSRTPEGYSNYFYHNWSLSDSPDYSGGGRGGGTRKRKHVKVLPHADFLARYAETDRVTLRDGSNPLLGWYQNASWFLS